MRRKPTPQLDHEKEKKLLDTGLFEVVRGFVWLRLKVPGDSIYIYCGSKEKFSNMWSSRSKPKESFEQILDRMPEELQTKLLFDLDLFV